MQSRYYNPTIGRFINADELIAGTTLQGNNLFAYCNNNPVMLVDPNGKIPFCDGFYDETFRQIGEWIGITYKDSISAFFDRLGAALSGSCSVSGEFGSGFGVKGKFGPVSVDASAIIVGDKWTQNFDGTSESIRQSSLTLQAELVKNINAGLDVVYSAPLGPAEKYGLFSTEEGVCDIILGTYAFDYGLGYSTVATQDIELSFGISGYFILGGGAEFSFNLSKFVQIWNSH